MNSNYLKFIKFIHLAGDLLWVNFAFFTGYYIKYSESTYDQIGNDKNITLLLLFNLSWIIASYFVKEYDVFRVRKYEKIVAKLLRIIIIHLLIITAFWVFKKAYYYSREQLAWTYLILTFSIILWRILLVYFIKKHRKSGGNFRRVIFVGVGEVSSQLEQLFNNRADLGYKILGAFDDTISKKNNYLGSVDKVEAYALANRVDEIYCSIPDLETSQIKALSEFADKNIVRIKMLPDIRGFVKRQLKIDFYDDIPVLLFRNIPLDDFINRRIKRVFDIVFSSLFIVFVLSWLYPILAFLVKTSSPGPVLFKQTRSGKDNTDFACWKFRSMYVNDDAKAGAKIVQATKNDPRITKIGAFMRKTSLDELPQFFNVLFGQMSIVGPRPHPTRQTEEYSKIIDKYMVRHFIKPGITGLAQVRGHRGETKDPKMMENRIRMDMLYVESWSFLLDVRIVIQTVANAFKKEGNAY